MPAPRASDKQFSIGPVAALRLSRTVDCITTDARPADTAKREPCEEWEIVCWRYLPQSFDLVNRTMLLCGNLNSWRPIAYRSKPRRHGSRNGGGRRALLRPRLSRAKVFSATILFNSCCRRNKPQSYLAASNITWLPPFWPEGDKSREREGRVLALHKSRFPHGHHGRRCLRPPAPCPVRIFSNVAAMKKHGANKAAPI
jgi:hypothetical protein